MNYSLSPHSPLFNSNQFTTINSTKRVHWPATIMECSLASRHRHWGGSCIIWTVATPWPGPRREQGWLGARAATRIRGQSWATCSHQIGPRWPICNSKWTSYSSATTRAYPVCIGATRVARRRQVERVHWNDLKRRRRSSSREPEKKFWYRIVLLSSSWKAPVAGPHSAPPPSPYADHLDRSWACGSGNLWACPCSISSAYDCNTWSVLVSAAAS